ncbi:MAG: hypothetical protein ACOCWC_05155 [Bacteroidota bacterium]
MKRPLILLSFLTVLIFLMSSCLKDVRYARKYVIEKPFKSLVLLPPTDITKTYYSQNPDIYDSIPPVPKDISKSSFVKDADKQEVIDKFIGSLSKQLSRYGFTVYGPEDLSELANSGQEAFVFSVAQLEIMEYPDTFTQEVVHNNFYYEQKTEINTVVQNTWFEFSQLNHPDRDMTVLFNMQHTADYIDGQYLYDYTRGGIVYEYTPYRIALEDIYRLNEFAGSQNARYIYDFLINIYVSDETGLPFNVNRYLMIDRDKRIIRRAQPEERFHIMKLEE